MERSQMVIEKSISDVNRIKEIAKCCIFITPEGVVVKENPNFVLEVVAVIGPYDDGAVKLSEAVLLEVGLNRSRPYGKAEGNVGRENRHAISKRYGHYHLTPDQYQLVAPHLFGYLTKYATEKVASWKNDWVDPRWVKFDTGEYRHISGQRRNYKWSIIEPCVRFSVDLRDELLLGDIFWAELFGFDNRQHKLDRLVAFMGNKFSGYKRTNRKKMPRSWMNYPRFAVAIEALRRLPWYLQVFVWKEHFGKHSYFHYEIMEQIGYEGFDPWEEQVREKALPNPEQRIIPPVKIRILRKSQKQLVFELYPPRPPELEGVMRSFEGKQVELSDSFDDEIPF